MNKSQVIGMIKSLAGRGGASNWNDLENKPFGEEIGYSDTLKVSKTIEELIELANSGQLVGGSFLKVSDSVVTMSDPANGFTVDFGGEVVDIPADAVGEAAFELFDGVVVFMEAFFSVGEQAVGVDLDGIVFPEKGVFVAAEILFDIPYISVTIPGFQFLTTVVKPIEKKFIPKHTHSAADVFGIPQADWEQTDENAVDYIKNKPVVKEMNRVVCRVEKDENGIERIKKPGDSSEPITISEFIDLFQDPYTTIVLLHRAVYSNPLAVCFPNNSYGLVYCVDGNNILAGCYYEKCYTAEYTGT